MNLKIAGPNEISEINWDQSATLIYVSKFDLRVCWRNEPVIYEPLSYQWQSLHLKFLAPPNAEVNQFSEQKAGSYETMT